MEPIHQNHNFWFRFLGDLQWTWFFWQLSGLHLRRWEQPNPDDSQFDFYHLLLSFIFRAMLGYRLNSTAISDCPTQLSFFASCPVAVMYHEARFCFFHQGGESVYMGVCALKIANWIRSLSTSRSKRGWFRGNFQTNYIFDFTSLSGMMILGLLHCLPCCHGLKLQAGVKMTTRLFGWSLKPMNIWFRVWDMTATCFAVTCGLVIPSPILWWFYLMLYCMYIYISVYTYNHCKHMIL